MHSQKTPRPPAAALELNVGRTLLVPFGRSSERLVVTAGHPGEYYLDSTAGFVYYVPHTGESMADTIGHLVSAHAARRCL